MIEIKVETSIKTVLKILNQIPEFECEFVENQLEKRLKKDGVILIARFNNTPAGCKIAYDRFNSNIYYSWLGGVIPKFRQKSIAQMLNEKMEHIAKKKGYEFIQFKTRNKFKPMLLFALKNNYQIVDFIKKENILEHRILLQKKL